MRFLVVALAVLVAAQAFRQYPLYKQCDPRWGSNEMGLADQGPDGKDTVCHQGCAMSSVSMALNGLGEQLECEDANPGVLNEWLSVNNGYTCIDGDCCNLVLNSPDWIGKRLHFISEAPIQPEAAVQAGLTSGNFVYVAHVHNRTHFVLLTGFDKSKPGWFTVNDPFYNTTEYAYDTIADVLLYEVRPGPSGTAKGKAARAAGSPTVPKQYPLYKQCDTLWGCTVMQVSTICQVGCLMSSTSMALAGWGINLESVLEANPGTFNAWLQTHHGYAGGDDFDEAAINHVNGTLAVWPNDGMHRTNDLSYKTISGYLDAKRVVIANVMKGAHFVLCIGYDTDGDTVYVNDPGFPNMSYSYSKDIVGWRIFDMK